MSTANPQSDPHFYEKLADELEIWVRTEQFLLADFMSMRGYDQKQVERWASEHERAGRAYQNAIKHEENYIVKNALTRKFDGGFARFYLINRHHYRNTDNDDTSGLKGPITLLTQRPERKSKRKTA